MGLLLAHILHNPLDRHSPGIFHRLHLTQSRCRKCAPTHLCGDIALLCWLLVQVRLDAWQHSVLITAPKLSLVTTSPPLLLVQA